jgi:hypothetical protein
LWLRFEFTLSAVTLTNNQECFFLRINNGANEVLHYGVKLVSGVYKHSAHIQWPGSGFGITSFTYGTLSFDTHYVVEFEWDSTNNTYEWKVDGAVAKSGSLTGDHQTQFDDIRIGASVHATSRNATVYIDNFFIDDTAYPTAPTEPIAKDLSIVYDIQTLLEPVRRFFARGRTILNYIASVIAGQQMQRDRILPIELDRYNQYSRAGYSLENLELSWHSAGEGQQWGIWSERPQDGGATEFYVASVDASGVIDFANKEHVLTTSHVLPAAFWGHDSSGPYAVSNDNDGNWVIIRPGTPSTVTVLDQPGDDDNATRKGGRILPYVSRLTSAAQYVAFQLRKTPQINSFIERIAFLTARPVTYVDLHTESPSPVVPGPVQIFARWFDGQPRLIFGTKELDPSGVAQVKEWIATPTMDQPTNMYTNTGGVKADLFPFEISGTRYLIGGGGNKIQLWVWNGSAYEVKYDIPLNITNMTPPTLFQGAEPFEADGEWYAAYSVFLDEGQTSTWQALYEGEIRLVKLTSGGVVGSAPVWDVILAHHSNLCTIEPEFVLRGTSVNIYYNVGPKISGELAVGNFNMSYVSLGDLDELDTKAAAWIAANS